MTTSAQQLAEQSLQTGTSSARSLDREGKGADRRRDEEVSGQRHSTSMARVTRQEWAPSILIFLLDVFIWMAIYGMASYLRNESATFSGSFQFAVIEIIQIAVIVQALFIIG